MIVSLSAAIGVTLFTVARLRRYLLFFQQDGYSGSRFFRWLKEKHAFDKRGSLVALLPLIGIFCLPLWLASILSVLCALALWAISWSIESDPRTSGKVRLVMTQRASKIYSLALFISVLGALLSISAVLALGGDWEAWAAIIIWIQITPFTLPVANSILWPFEQELQARFKRDAEGILKDVHPFIIGITGSYGKTSTKAVLGDLLNQCVGPTFWPRGSINTVMGITRDIRENLRPSHRFAIIEMGAYGIGSIKKLCDFTPPRAAIVTAVGLMHLDRFGGTENIYRAKSELPQALPKDGILVCNGDNPGARRMGTEFRTGTVLFYGFDETKGLLDCRASELEFTPEGSRFTIDWRGKKYKVTTPLLGKPAVSNALAAFSLTCALGGSPAFVAASLSTIQPVKNRLSIEKAGGATYLHDAFNSNPSGFEAALEVLKGMPVQRKILVTPGMIELGEKQESENEKVGEQAGSFLNLAIIVGATNRAPLVRGLKKGGLEEKNVCVVDTRAEAFERLAALRASGDGILIENDLPDLYEGDARF